MALTEEERKERARVSNRKWMAENKDKIKRYYQLNSDKVKARVRKYREANANTVKESQKRYRDANKDKIKERDITYRRKNREQCATRDRDYFQINKGSLMEASKIGKRSGRKTLSDWYIKDILRRGTGLAITNIPQDLIQLKRQHLKITRLLKDRKQNGKHS